MNYDDEWRNIRVFISSTFRDTHGERDILTRKIFPKLREWCASQYLTVTEVDLRWGVTQTEPALPLCLEEIDRYRNKCFSLTLHCFHSNSGLTYFWAS